MSSEKRGNVLVALWGAAGVFLVGFFGAEALFAPGELGLSASATLIPAGVAAVATFAFLLTQPSGERAAAQVDREEPGSRKSELFRRSHRRGGPKARRAA